MKRYLILFLLSFSVTFFGCKDDDTDSEIQDTFKIIRSAVTFEAVGGEGFIEIEAPVDSKITATSSVDTWCKILETTNSSIKVQVNRNGGYTGRSSLITITDGENSEYVAVTQQGNIFNVKGQMEWRLRNHTQQLTLQVQSSFTYKVDKNVDWITVLKSKEGVVDLQVEENNTGKPRATLINVTTAEGRLASYAIYQYDGDDLIGAYAAQAYISWQVAQAEGYMDLENISITKNDLEEYIISFSVPFSSTRSFNYKFKATFDDDALMIETGQYQEGQGLEMDETGTMSYAYGLWSIGNTLRLTDAVVGLAPGLFQIENDVIMGLTYKDKGKVVSESSSYLGIGFFKEPELTVENYIQESTLFLPRILFYNQQ